MMAVEGVKLWFDQALYKESGGRVTDYHVDAAFWPVHPAAKTTTIWMVLVDVPREKGCMAFASLVATNCRPTPNLSISSMRKRRSRIGDNLRHYPWEWVPLEQGDCTFHSGLVYHRAGGNSTDEMREAMTIAYMTADATFDWPESNPEAGRRHGFATEGIDAALDLLVVESCAALGISRPPLRRILVDACQKTRSTSEVNLRHI